VLSDWVWTYIRAVERKTGVVFPEKWDKFLHGITTLTSVVYVLIFNGGEWLELTLTSVPDSRQRDRYTLEWKRHVSASLGRVENEIRMTHKKIVTCGHSYPQYPQYVFPPTYPFPAKKLMNTSNRTFWWCLLYDVYSFVLISTNPLNRYLFSIPVSCPCARCFWRRCWCRFQLKMATAGSSETLLPM
jgi:hypothetical protein